MPPLCVDAVIERLYSDGVASDEEIVAENERKCEHPVEHVTHLAMAQRITIFLVEENYSFRIAVGPSQ